MNHALTAEHTSHPSPDSRRFCHRFSGIAVAVFLGCLAVALPASASDEAAARQAREILRASGVNGGVIVHVGCGDGRLTAALHDGDQYVVQGLDVDPAQVARAREHLQSRSVCGPVSVDTYAGQRLPYADNFVNLVVAEQRADLPMDDVMRVLCPGGVLCVRAGGTWHTTRKPWPQDMDQWTHYLHGPDGNAVAQDRLVGPPRRLQWIAPPRWLRHHNTTISFSAMVSAGGRLFYIIDDSPPGVVGLPDQWKLVARDAFNGTLLWQQRLDDWGWSAWTGTPNTESHSRFDAPLDVTRRLVASDNRVYVAMEHAPLRALDAATGKTVRTYPGTQRLSEVLHHDGLLIVSVHRPSSDKSKRVTRRGVPAPLFAEDLLVLDADSGTLRWKKTGWHGVESKRGPLRPYTHLYLAADSKQVYLVDRDSVVSLDLQTGRQLWQTPRPQRKETLAKYSSIITSNLCTLVVHDDVVLFSQLAAYAKNPWYEPSSTTLLALSKESGKELWRLPVGNWNCYSPPDLFVIDRLVWTHSRTKPYELLGLEPTSGRVQRRIPTEKAMVTEHHHRCYRNKATSRFVLTGRRGIELTDLESGNILLNHWIRGACRYGIMPCNGLIYAPPDPCICYITAKVSGMVALASGSNLEPGATSMPRLERGPAYASLSKVAGANQVPTGDQAGASSADQWPTYRHDERRTGASSTNIPVSLAPRWQAEINSKVSAPVIADGRLLVAAVDRHRVIAFDPDSGKTLWDFTCAGRVDSPPTIYRGSAIFGSADGSVYALRADDGRLAWRFQAAPDRRKIGSFGQIESAWPVHGSVLIRDGVAYFAAGRSSFLDGGITVYGLDPVTGRALQQRTLANPDPTTNTTSYDKRLRYDMPPDRPGALADVLVSDGQHIFMRHIRMDPRDIGRDLEKERPEAEVEAVYRRQIPRIYSPGPQVASSVGLLAENWFNQTYWSFAGRSQCRLLVCDDTFTYGVRAYPGRPARHSRAKFVAGKGTYTLFADRRAARVERVWSQPLSIRVSALLIARDKLVVAGAPDVISTDDPWAAEQGRGPGVLAIFSAADGKELNRIALAAPPIWNGIAAANGRLYVALKNGHLVCLAAE